MSKIDIYADGACRGNGAENNVGAYAYMLVCGDRVKKDVQLEHNTTNNRMELMSVISALKALNPSAKDYSITVYSDSQYVVNGATTWYKGWEFKNYAGVKNPELWKELISLKNLFPYINFVWVKGHDNIPGNLEVDKLCNDKMDGKI